MKIQNRKQTAAALQNLINFAKAESFAGASINGDIATAETLLEQISQPFFEICGRRWFDRSAGNTYHTVTVYVDGEELGHSEMRCGGDSCYIQTAAKMLQDAGYFKKTGKSLESGYDADLYEFEEYRRKYRENFVISHKDVLKKEL